MSKAIHSTKISQFPSLIEDWKKLRYLEKKNNLYRQLDYSISFWNCLLTFQRFEKHFLRKTFKFNSKYIKRSYGIKFWKKNGLKDIRLKKQKVENYEEIWKKNRPFLLSIVLKLCLLTFCLGIISDQESEILLHPLSKNSQRNLLMNSHFQ